MTPRATERFTIAGPAGALELVIHLPAEAPCGIALVAHPNPVQGGTLDHKVAPTLARTFHALGYASVRLNFRGVGASEGAFDDVVPLADVFAWARPQQLPIVVFPGCGHFFHGRLSQLAATITGLWHGRPPVVPGA